MADREVQVVVALAGDHVVAGRLWSHQRRNTESATFAYDAAFLAHPGAYPLDPALPLTAGAQQTAVGRALFGAFGDSAPDRWGRRLIARSERRRAREEGDAERSFGEADLLLGVRDDLRQGALRYRDPRSARFLADDATGVPPLVELPRLLGAAERLEREDEDAADLAVLLRGGSSLGGARPKAHVLAGDGRTAIAKFPSPANDEWDVIRWEAVTLRLAQAAGLTVPRHELHVVDGKAVLVLDRFDRAGARRIGYVSAMTMLERADGDHGSYLEIADVIERESPRATADLHELWRRIAFSVLVSNTDDHLRNHGFLRTSTAGWTLSPAFDLNPDPRPGAKVLQTTIDLDDPTASVELLLAVAADFRLRPDAAREVLRDVAQATAGWVDAARAVGLDAREIDRVRPAFEHAERDRAAA